MSRGILVVISGPSGAGKDTLMSKFLEENTDWVHPPSTTTRDPRPGEEHDKDMKFVNEETFKKWQEEGRFLESIKVQSEKWYGTLKEPVERALGNGKNVMLRLDVRGAMELKERMPEAILIFLKAENLRAFKDRMRSRGSETDEQLDERIKMAETELAYEDRYDHVIVNETGKIDEAYERLNELIAGLISPSR